MDVDFDTSRAYYYETGRVASLYQDGAAETGQCEVEYGEATP